MIYPVATVQLRWLTPDEGGRQAPPRGPTYAATAHFADETVEQSFSVVLCLLFSPSAKDGIVELTLLAPSNLPAVVQRFVPGSQLRITEGTRTVAECQVESVRMEDRSSWREALRLTG